MRNLAIGLLIVTLIFGSLLTLTFPSAEASSPGEPAIAGKRAIVINASTGVILYEKNANERAAPASLTKLFTGVFAIENTPLQRRMAVVKDDLVGEASAGLETGEDLSFETLLHGLMLASGNDAAMAIARNVGASESPSELNGVTSFINDANERLQSLGLHDTHLVNPHGLDTEGHYSSARDIAAITMLGLQTEPEFLAAISSPGYIGAGHHFVQTNQLPVNYPGAIGGKTGITDDAGYCLMGIAHRDGQTIISVVMGSTPNAWYADVMTLFDHGFATLAVPGHAEDRPIITLASYQPVAMMASQHPVAQTATLHEIGGDAASVRSISAAGNTPWQAWRWPLGATLAMVVVMVCAIQTRSLIELQKRPRRRGRRPGVARPQPRYAPASSQQPSGETQPFATIGAWDYSRSSSGHTVWSGSAGD
ncbi:hypothetical protein BH23CHL1_BH23CHL1_21230 [soil metagenome]